jgi:hypothetical protein
MSHEPDEALQVLRTLWSAQGQGGQDIGDEAAGSSCKRMADVGFGGLADDSIDSGDLRTAWRAQLAREGKLDRSPGASLADLVLGSGPGPR